MERQRATPLRKELRNLIASEVPGQVADRSYRRSRVVRPVEDSRGLRAGRRHVAQHKVLGITPDVQPVGGAAVGLTQDGPLVAELPVDRLEERGFVAPAAGFDIDDQRGRDGGSRFSPGRGLENGGGR
jgi:hypothetical protein